MAKKYIESDALITCMEENCDTWKNDYMRRGFRECARIVFDMPAADVVEVVRCGQCKFFQSSGCFIGIQGAQISSDNYCAWGQRKDGDAFLHYSAALYRTVASKEHLPSVQPEAKPPKWVAEDRYIKNSFVEYPHCPQCNADVTTGQCYCMICGQHIDWSEDDG